MQTIYFPLRSIAFFIIIISIILAISPIAAYAYPLRPIAAEQSIYTIEVYPQRNRLIVRVRGQQIKAYPVAVGNPSTPTPIGVYYITYKGTDWGPSFGPRWLGLNVPWGNYGIHGTNKPYSIGQHMSHGCIRMFNRDVLELYEMIPIGTKVTIYGHVLGAPKDSPRDLAEGDVGGDVLLIQSRLKSAGYFDGICNGKFRASTTSALKKFQRDQRMIQDGVVSQHIYEALGLIE
ncbi:L,D-transpeptidase family protein [Paenibacillus sp. SC116]|uniref:L,D-transpeptidase family protein n=1 Tax=Paenibacillus sp. SC116 TaxID=2968986 RepID=UPI00215B17CC|nr:L,D-transpeptidase family protein [Paenibacillus sp. SC116]MCR8842359.1 L,D-transpeptidase family protein [Paenibacillus sp. SC116]